MQCQYIWDIISNYHAPAKFVHAKVADLHISPYESKEVNAAKASYAQGRLKVLIINVKNGNDPDCAPVYFLYAPIYALVYALG